MKKSILFGMIFCLSTSICACGNKTPSAGTYEKPKMVLKEEQQEQEQEQAQEQEQEQEQQEDTSTQEETETMYTFGETANLKDWSITVTDMSIVDSIKIDFLEYTPSADDSLYLVVYATATNNGKKADTFLSDFPMSNDVIAKAIYSDGYEFTASDFLGYEHDFHYSAINPLSSLSGEVIFAVPEVVANSTEPLIIRFSCGSEKVEFKLR